MKPAYFCINLEPFELDEPLADLGLNSIDVESRGYDEPAEGALQDIAEESSLDVRR
jgi:hypothetical protein